MYSQRTVDYILWFLMLMFDISNNVFISDKVLSLMTSQVSQENVFNVRCHLN